MIGEDGLIKYKLVAIDTNIFIYHYSGNPSWVQLTEQVFNSLADDKIKAVTSSLTLAELLSFKTSDLKLKELFESFIITPNLTILPLDTTTALEAARIRRQYGFRLPDSVQLATALTAKAQAFITNDKNLRSFREIPVIK